VPTDSLTAMRRIGWDGAVVFGVEVPPAIKVGPRDSHYTAWYSLLINDLIPKQMGRVGMDAFINAGFNPLTFYERHSEPAPAREDDGA
jgi:hypothetical protein